MADDIFLIRKNLQWARYDDVEEVSLTGAPVLYSTVTGNSGTNVITVTGSAPTDGQQVVFPSLTGGSSVSTGVSYYARDVSGATFKIAATLGGSVVALGSDITAGTAFLITSEMRVWSAEYRDIFTSTSAAEASSLDWSNVYAANGTTLDVAVGGANQTSGTAYLSDEVRHVALRQTLLSKTHWRFDRGATASPRYLYATWQDGDIIADNAPETDPD